MDLKIFHPFVLVLFFVFSSCQKENTSNEISAFTGTYDYEFVTTGQDDSGSYSDSGRGVMLVASFGGVRMLFTDDDGTQYEAIYDGDGNFHLVEDLIDYGGGEVYRISGEGLFGNGKMQLILMAEAAGYFNRVVISMKGDKR